MPIPIPEQTIEAFLLLIINNPNPTMSKARLTGRGSMKGITERMIIIISARTGSKKDPRPVEDRSGGASSPYSPMNRAAIVFMISFVPAKIRVTRMSRHARAIGYSSQ